MSIGRPLGIGERHREGPQHMKRQQLHQLAEGLSVLGVTEAVHEPGIERLLHAAQGDGRFLSEHALPEPRASSMAQLEVERLLIEPREAAQWHLFGAHESRRITARVDDDRREIGHRTNPSLMRFQRRCRHRGIVLSSAFPGDGSVPVVGHHVQDDVVVRFVPVVAVADPIGRLPVELDGPNRPLPIDLHDGIVEIGAVARRRPARIDHVEVSAVGRPETPARFRLPQLREQPLGEDLSHGPPERWCERGIGRCVGVHGSRFGRAGVAAS
jgi:hypothetical protein